jgi:hypothetical protein
MYFKFEKANTSIKIFQKVKTLKITKKKKLRKLFLTKNERIENSLSSNSLLNFKFEL